VSYELAAAPSPRRCLLSWGLSAPQSLYDDGAVAPVGLTRILFAVFHCPAAPKCPDGSALRYPRRRPPATSIRCGDPLTSFGSPTEYDPYATVRGMFRLTPTIHATHPFRGFFPFSVFPVARSHLPPVSFHLTGYVAPLGFRTPATPCSPHDLPSLFHPGPARGVVPSRPCSPRNAVRSLERRDPHAIGSTPKHRPPPQGFARSEDPARESWGLAKIHAGCPRGIVPLRGFLLAAPRCEPNINAPNTLTRFIGSAASWPHRRRPRAYNVTNAAVLSRDRHNLLEVLHLVGLLGSLVAPWRWVMAFPQRPSRVAADHISSLHHRRAPCRSSPRTPYR
jgi:hypothetical protein